MELFLKILPIIVSIVVAVFTWFGSFRDLRKDRKENFQKQYDLSIDLENFSTTSVTQSQLVKDRLAKLVFNSESLNYQDAMYFNKYYDGDVWIKRFLEIKPALNIHRNSKNEITYWELKQHKLGWLWRGIWYFICIIIGTAPYSLFEHYKKLIDYCLEISNYVALVELILIPPIFILIALQLAWKQHKHKEAKQFIIDFDQKAKLV